MHYNLPIKNRVRLLRTRGLSLNQIHEEMKVPIATISNWVSDIELSKHQQTILKQRSQKALQEGRTRIQRIKKNQRKDKERFLLLKGKEEIGKLNSRELFIAGIALYWAEGFKNKHERRLGFCNSDPKMIKFYIYWLEKVLGVNKEDLVIRLTLNASYKYKVKELEEYWSGMIRVPITQFTKTFYQTSKWKKQFNTDDYHGVLRIHVRESLDFLFKMKGWIEGLKSDKIVGSLPG